jgi:molybdopterin molybdotransferase
MLELEDALELVLAEVAPPLPEEIPLNQSHGRILARTVHSVVDLPLFDNSAMDGYAARAEDVASAHAESAVRLSVIGRAAAGEVFRGQVSPGTCVRVFTGSAMPMGADAVVMQEDTRALGEQGKEVLVLSSVKPWESVRLKGEDLKAGQELASAGVKLTPTRLGLLAACGCERVSVGRQPVVGLLATGSELREPGQTLQPGQIYDSNRIMLSTLVSEAGGLPKVHSLVPDTLEDTRRALVAAFGACDLVVSSGGVSVGEMDFVKRAFEEKGGGMQFWKVAIKPGRPFVFGQAAKKLFFGLPGNPVSALVTFLLLVRPALLRWQGAREVQLRKQPGLLAEPLMNPGERRHFFRVNQDADGKAYSTGLQASHILSSLAAANGLVDVPPRTTFPEGSKVKVLTWHG